MRCLVIYGPESKIYHMIQDDEIDGEIFTKIIDIPEGGGIKFENDEPFADDSLLNDNQAPEIEPPVDGEYVETEGEEEQAPTESPEE